MQAQKKRLPIWTGEQEKRAREWAEERYKEFEAQIAYNEKIISLRQNVQQIETVYAGYKFRSRLEARWAVFFDACGVKWEYEPEGFDLGEGIHYLPDFLLHNVRMPDGLAVGNREGYDVWVEVKGVLTNADLEKIKRFIGKTIVIDDDRSIRERPLLVLGQVPYGNTICEVEGDHMPVYRESRDHMGIMWANTVTGLSDVEEGNNIRVFPCVADDGGFVIAYGGYDEDNGIDESATCKAYNKAHAARFEWGEKP